MSSVTLRCKLDGLMLPAQISPLEGQLIAFDGDEPFAVEALEALYYELVTATGDEVLTLERSRYRLLRKAPDFRLMAG